MANAFYAPSMDDISRVYGCYVYTLWIFSLQAMAILLTVYMFRVWLWLHRSWLRPWLQRVWKGHWLWKKGVKTPACLFPLSLKKPIQIVKCNLVTYISVHNADYSFIFGRMN